MKISFTSSQHEKAMGDVLDVYELAEEKMKLSAIPYSLVQLRNAFQVFRYAFREWALWKDRGVVLRALMVSENAGREVASIGKELVISCEDESMGEAIARLLEGDGYVEEGN